MSAPSHPSQILSPGENCWRSEPGCRVAPIIDADRYFRTARSAILRAQHSILIVGWDFHPRTRLCPGEDAEPDGTGTIGGLLKHMVRQNPRLEVRVLKWNLSLLFAPARRIAPAFMRDWWTSPRLRFQLDPCHPAGACHHQKLLVVDDAVAFCGGIDFSGNRWDNRAHRDGEPCRRRPVGQPYPPIHDMMLAVGGAAAAALGELARERWRRATGERLDAPPREPHRPAAALLPDVGLDGVRVGVARSMPAFDQEPEIREVERLYLDMIAAAEDAIYIENQYLLPTRVVDALAERLRGPRGPEVVCVTSASSSSWLEQETMDVARDLAVRQLREADRHDRFRVYARHTGTGGLVHIHAKTMVVDDRFLRIGSANINNRSMGFDTECDVVVEAPSGAEGSAARRAVRRYRDGLIAEHLGLSAEEVGRAVSGDSSFLQGVEALRSRGARETTQLAALPSAQLDGFEELAQNRLSDPTSPEPRANFGTILRAWRGAWSGTPF